jgi:hypothetical protein
MQEVELEYAAEASGMVHNRRFANPLDARFAFDLDDLERAAKDQTPDTTADAVRAGMAVKAVSVRCSDRCLAMLLLRVYAVGPGCKS